MACEMDNFSGFLYAVFPITLDTKEIQMNNKFLRVLFPALFVVLFSFSQASNAADSNEPIKVPLKNWSSQLVMAYVIGGMFESMGNSVEYIPVDNQASFEAVRLGEVTLVHEVWQSTMQNAYYNAMAQGGLIDAGTHAAATLEEMGVPTWVIEKDLCPGLPNWEALKNCHEVFATPDSEGKGRWLEGPQSWHGDTMPNRLKGLGLDDNWVVKFAGGADALWTELKAAEKEGRGTIIFNWSPNFTDASGFTFIEFPPYYDGCRIKDGGTSRNYRLWIASRLVEKRCQLQVSKNTSKSVYRIFKAFIYHSSNWTNGSIG